MNLITRTASVRWQGGPKGGTRAVSTKSGILEQAKFSSGIPFQNDPHTDPTELIAAAHASSFSLALSKELALSPPALGDIVTTATVSAENLATGWTILNIHLNVIAKLPAMTQGQFIDATVRAKLNCLVSRLLRANISMNAKLEKQTPPLATKSTGRIKTGKRV